MSTHNIWFSCRNKKKNYLATSLINFTWQRAKIRMRIFSTSRLLVDDQSSLQKKKKKTMTDYE